nr:putative RNA-dependent RNA polymerase [Poaceae Liege totivirus 1]
MGYIPLYLNTDNNYVREVPFLSSTHCLYDMIPNLFISGSFNYNLGTCAVTVHCIPFPQFGLTAMYLYNHHVLTGLTQPHRLRISRIQYGPDMFPFGTIHYNNVLEYCFHITTKALKYTPRLEYSLVRAVLSKEIILEVSKVSAKHLRHLTINEFSDISYTSIHNRLGATMVLLENLIAIRVHESFFVGVLTWLLMLPDDALSLISKSELVHCKYTDVEHFAKYVKNNFSLRLKALQNNVHIDLAPFFELEVLVNRGVGDINWEDEKDHRINTNATNISPEDIFIQAGTLFARLKLLGARPKRYSWDSFWATRWQWAPTGAYSSQYKEDDAFKHADHDMRHKFYGFCAMPEYSYEHFIERRAEFYAKASVKYEWGKQRAIYGVDNTNFIISSYGMAGCEEVLSKLFPIGQEAESTRVQTKVSEVLKNGIPYCFDFEDFNSQHTTAGMRAVLEAYMVVFNDKLESEQLGAIEWLHSALECVNVKQLNGQTYVAEGTLLSGWRLTTFMNTVLNYVYTKILTSEAPFVTTHNGDDILGAVTSLHQIRNMESNAVRYNIRFQNSKCFLGAIAEFLRVDHHNGNGAQYLSRAVSTFVHGPTEMAIPNDPVAVINAILTRADELRKRQARPELVDHLERKQLSYLCKKWEIDKRVITHFRKTHRLLGGYSTSIEDDALRYRFHRTRIKTDVGGEGTTQREKILPGVFSYCRHMAHKYGLEAYFKQLLNTANIAVYSRSLRYKFGVQVERCEPDSIVRLHAIQYGMFNAKFSGVKATISKSFGIPIEAIRGDDTYIINLLSWCKDPVMALGLWC